MIGESYVTKYYFSEDPEKGEKLSLSLLICPDAFVFSISGKDSNLVHTIGHVELTDHSLPAFQLHDKISHLVQNYSLHERKFSKIYISVLNQDFTLVPSAFARPEDLKKFLKFSSGKTDVRNGTHRQIKNLSFCYTIDPDLLYYLEKTFSNAIINHNGTISLSAFLGQHSLKANNLFLAVYTSHIELAMKNGSELLFYNVYSYNSQEDVLYYLFFMMEQFLLNPLQVKLVVVAQTGVSEDLIRSIRKYIKHVSFGVNDPSVKLSGELKSLPHHYYFTLLNQHLCEL